jgi:hypothetical protein
MRIDGYWFSYAAQIYEWQKKFDKLEDEWQTVPRFSEEWR